MACSSPGHLFTLEQRPYGPNKRRNHFVKNLLVLKPLGKGLNSSLILIVSRLLNREKIIIWFLMQPGTALLIVKLHRSVRRPSCRGESSSSRALSASLSPGLFSEEFRQIINHVFLFSGFLQLESLARKLPTIRRESNIEEHPLFSVEEDGNTAGELIGRDSRRITDGIPRAATETFKRFVHGRSPSTTCSYIHPSSRRSE